MLVNILLVVHIIVCVLLGGAVLLQRSEGGALGMGGGPSGFMTARGTGDLLTRSTWILFTLFLLLTIALTMLLGHRREGQSVTGRGEIERLDPNALSKPAAPTPAPTAPVGQLPPPTTTAPGVPGSAASSALGGVAPAETPPTK